MSEVSQNFNPALPPDLNISVSDGSEKKGGSFSKHGPEDKHLNPEEVQKNTQELFNLLVHRVELRIDIARQSEKSGGTSNNAEQEMSLQERLDLIKNGELRSAVNQLVGGDTKARTLETDLRELRETEGKISDLSKNTQVVEEYSKFREKRVDKLRQAKEATNGHVAIKELLLQQEKMARTAFLGNRQYSPGERRIIDENRQVIQAINERVSKLKEDPEVFDLVRIRQLEGYQRGLKTDRFAETPSREKYIDSVRLYWAQGRRVLLTGPTGGGKTELLLHASRSLFGAEAERLTGHELMTNYEVYGKTKGGVQEGKISLMFGAAPFIRALEKNVPFVFDEINVVPNKILMRLKTDLNARVGSRVTIQEDGDKEVIVGDKFAIGATENVKSEKYVDREKLDPALVRMFESMAIDYFPPDELYDTMLASMMDVRGGVKLSVKDASSTLKSLCDATEWVQKAYLGQIIDTSSGQILEARGQRSLGKPATLREAVLDFGKSLDMLVGWEDAEKSGLTFREFLNKKITAFVNNENFPEEDRYYLTEIFALQGFLKGVKVSELRVPGLDQATLDAWSGYDGKRYVSKNNYTPPEIVAKLDPYGNLQRPVSVEAGDLLDEGELMEEVKEEDVDVNKAAATAAQTRVAQQPSIKTSGAMFTSAGVSPEGLAKIQRLDTIYDPKALPESETQRFNDYPRALVGVARAEPTTAVAIADRFFAIFDRVHKLDLSNLYFFLPYFADFAKTAKSNPQALSKVVEVFVEIIKACDSGFTSSRYDAVYWDTVTVMLERIRKLVI